MKCYSECPSHLVHFGVAQPRIDQSLQDMHCKKMKRLEQIVNYVATRRKFEREGKDKKT